MRWIEHFEGPTLKLRSRIGLVWPRRPHPHATDILSFYLSCRGAEVRWQTQLRLPLREREEEGELSLADYLGFWSEIRSSGFLELALQGKTPPKGQELYFEAEVGEPAVGWVFSTDFVALNNNPELEKMYQALNRLGHSSSPLYAEHVGSFGPSDTAVSGQGKS